MIRNAVLALAPEGILVGAAFLLIAVAAVAPRRSRLAAGVALTAALAALVASLGLSRLPPVTIGLGLVVDRFALLLDALLALIAVLVMLQAFRVVDRSTPPQDEFFALLLLATSAAMLTASAVEMAAFFVALELLAISVYVLVCFLPRRAGVAEAAARYAITGMASAGVLLYGLALLYGLTGHTDLKGVAPGIGRGPPSAALVLALALVIAGLGWKLALVPFHAWALDIYGTAPFPVVAFLATAPVVAALAVLLRVLLSAFGGLQGDWAPLLAILAGVTMTLGSLAALRQEDIRRLLAYATIRQSGFLLVGALEGGGGGVGALLFLLLATVLSSLAAFGAVIAYDARSDSLADLRGMARRAPFLGATLSLALLSLTGVPPLFGFFGKFFVLLSAVRGGYTWLALVAVGSTILSAIFSLRVISTLYLEDAPTSEAVPLDGAMRWSLVACVAAVVVLGAAAGPLLDLTNSGATALLMR